MSKTYDVTDHEVGGNTIKIWIHTKPDGSLSVDDYSYGDAADAFYGPGRGVENSFTLKPDAVHDLYRALGGRDRHKRTDKLAEMLTQMFRGDTKALGKIRGLCDRWKVAYKSFLWIENA